MTNLSLLPTVEVEFPVGLSAGLLESGVDLPEKVLRERAARYILAGSDSLTLEELDEAQAALRNRMARAEASGITPREVLLSLLRPAFSSGDHCRCHSCRQTCAICGSTGTGN